jgi:hypothetical protein
VLVPMQAAKEPAHGLHPQTLDAETKQIKTFLMRLP